MDVPFAFITGYDANTIPAEFGDATLLQKPQDPGAIVAEIMRQQSGNQARQSA